jgi:hypothetical protein
MAGQRNAPELRQAAAHYCPAMYYPWRTGGVRDCSCLNPGPDPMSSTRSPGGVKHAGNPRAGGDIWRHASAQCLVSTSSNCHVLSYGHRNSVKRSFYPRG